MNSKIKACVIHYRDHTHLLDHLAPIADLFEIPIYIEDEEQYQLLKKYYPFVQAKYCEPSTIGNPFYFYSNYQIVFGGILTNPVEKDEYNLLQKPKKFLRVYTPHGNSDKGHVGVWMEYFAGEQAVMLYGNRIINFLKLKKAYDSISHKILMGNLRLHFFEKYRLFFMKMVETEVFSKIDPKKKTLLYCPSCLDFFEQSTTFFDVYENILEKLQNKFNVIVKFHPNLYRQYPGQIIWLTGQFKNITFLENYPYVYPILEKADIYLGDFSSVNYDFLYFNRPMFFIHHNKFEKNSPSRFISNCGFDVPIDAYDHIDEFIENHLPQDKQFHEKRKKVYLDTFDPGVKPEKIKENIYEIYQKL
jgi:hypothetical protein